MLSLSYRLYKRNILPLGAWDKINVKLAIIIDLHNVGIGRNFRDQLFRPPHFGALGWKFLEDRTHVSAYPVPRRV